MSLIEMIRSIGRSLVQKVKSWWSQLRESIKKKKQVQRPEVSVIVWRDPVQPLKKIRERQQKNQSDVVRYYFQKKRTQRKRKS